MGVIRYPQKTRTGVMGVVLTFTNLEPCINYLLYVMELVEIATVIIIYYLQNKNWRHERSVNLS